MVNDFHQINTFVSNSQQKIDLFWNTVQGNFKSESILILLAMVPLIPFLMGIAILIERVKASHNIYFIGMARFSSVLPDIFAIVFNVSLWISYFLFSIAIIISCYKLLGHKSDILVNDNSVKLAQTFSPVDTVIFSSLRISQELEKYSKARMPSDFGLGGDIDWIEGCFYKVLTGKRPTGSYSGPSIQTNSFFAGLENEKDIRDRLDLKHWYPENQVQNDRIIEKIFQLKDYVFHSYLWHDYSLGADAYKSLAQTFLFASLKDKEAFKENLDATLEIYSQYSKSKAPLKGVPHYVVRFTPKVLKTIFVLSFYILLIILITIFLPEWLVKLGVRFKIVLDINDVKAVVNNSTALIGLLGSILILIWK